MTPLGQGSGAVLFENSAAVEVALIYEVVVDRCVGGGECLQGLDVPEPGHRAFCSVERVV